MGSALYLGLLRLPARRLFTVTSWMVLLLAAGMASQAAGYLVQADLLPPLGNAVWDTSAVLTEDSVLGNDGEVFYFKTNRDAPRGRARGPENFRPLAAEGHAKHWTHIDYLQRLIDGEAAARQDRTVLRRIKAARFPVIKTLDTFRWDWQKRSINSRYRICSACASSTRKPMSSSSVYVASAKPT